MKNYTFLIVFVSLIIFSCDTDSTSVENEQYEDVTYKESSPQITEEIIQIENKKEELLSDSLGVIFNDLLLEYNSLRKSFQSNKSQYFKIAYEDFDIYTITSEIWYFDSLLNLVYYEQDMGGEGGYQNFYFQSFNDSKLTFYYSSIIDADELTNEHISKFSRQGELLNNLIHIPIQNGDIKYSVPFDKGKKLGYANYLKPLFQNDFKLDSNNVYNYEDSKIIDSEYGLESVGNKILIDSVLLTKVIKQR